MNNTVLVFLKENDLYEYTVYVFLKRKLKMSLYFSSKMNYTVLIPGGGTRVGECRVCADLTSKNRPLERPNFCEKVTLRETF